MVSSQLPQVLHPWAYSSHSITMLTYVVEFHGQNMGLELWLGWLSSL